MTTMLTYIWKDRKTA